MGRRRHTPEQSGRWRTWVQEIQLLAPIGCEMGAGGTAHGGSGADLNITPFAARAEPEGNTRPPTVSGVQALHARRTSQNVARTRENLAGARRGSFPGGLRSGGRWDRS